ncbi:MAG: hypothetical protein ABSE16_01375 [Verrucomicrobiota bacterium]
MPGICAISSPGTDLDTNGVTLLREVDPTLTGVGVRVAQPEAVADVNSNDFEVVPSQLGEPVSLFTYFATNLESATGFPTTLAQDPTMRPLWRRSSMVWRGFTITTAAWPLMWRTWTIIM